MRRLLGGRRLCRPASAICETCYLFLDRQLSTFYLRPERLVRSRAENSLGKKDIPPPNLYAQTVGHNHEPFTYLVKNNTSSPQTIPLENIIDELLVRIRQVILPIGIE